MEPKAEQQAGQRKVTEVALQKTTGLICGLSAKKKVVGPHGSRISGVIRLARVNFKLCNGTSISYKTPVTQNTTITS